MSDAEYYRDRYKMLLDSASSLAEYRMYRIFELEKELEEYKARFLQWEPKDELIANQAVELTLQKAQITYLKNKLAQQTEFHEKTKQTLDRYYNYSSQLNAEITELRARIEQLETLELTEDDIVPPGFQSCSCGQNNPNCVECWGVNQGCPDHGPECPGQYGGCIP